MVGAAVDTEPGCEDDTSNETKEHCKTIQDKEGDWNGQQLDKDSCEAIKNGNHTESRSEDSVVDAGWVSGESICNNIADQGHSKQRP